MRNILIILLTLSLTGCFWTKKAEVVQVETRVEPVKIFHPALPPKISLSNIEWKVVTPEILEEYIKQYQAGNAEPLILYGLSVKDYELLAEDMSKIKKLLEDQKELIIYYRSLDQ